jgi:hypothetical protein
MSPSDDYPYYDYDDLEDDIEEWDYHYERDAWLDAQADAYYDYAQEDSIA